MQGKTLEDSKMNTGRTAEETQGGKTDVPGKGRRKRTTEWETERKQAMRNQS